MMDGLLMAAYLAAAVAEPDDWRLAPAMRSALDRLRTCVTAKMGTYPVDQLRHQPPRAEVLETVGQALTTAARTDDEFARQLSEIIEELERGGARVLVAGTGGDYLDNERTGRPSRTEGSRGVIFCEACGTSNSIGAEYCELCGMYLARNPNGSVPEGSASQPVPPPAGPAAQLPPVPPASLPSQPGESVQLQSVIDRAVSQVVTEGRVLFNPPGKMRQGKAERVEVAVARTKHLDDTLRQLVRGRGDARIADLETSPFMAVELKGPAFDVTPLQAATGEQLLRSTALWEFDVLPRRSGSHTLQVCVAMRIPLPDRPDERISIPVLERPIQVVIDPRYGSQQFVKRNWQWLIATLLGLGGAVAAWLKLFPGGG